MTIHLPPGMESSIQAAVDSGHFASVDEAMIEAACLLLQKVRQNGSTVREIKPDPLLGSMPDAADELDEIVADAMKRRRDEPWRTIPGE